MWRFSKIYTLGRAKDDFSSMSHLRLSTGRAGGFKTFSSPKTYFSQISSILHFNRFGTQLYSANHRTSIFNPFYNRKQVPNLTYIIICLAVICDSERCQGLSFITRGTRRRAPRGQSADAARPPKRRRTNTTPNSDADTEGGEQI